MHKTANLKKGVGYLRFKVGAGMFEPDLDEKVRKKTFKKKVRKAKRVAGTRK